MSLRKTIATFFYNLIGTGKLPKSKEFVENFVIPDMLDNGFGFGRAAVGAALANLGVRSFQQIWDLTPEQLEIVRNSRGVGPKVWDGFVRYLNKRGVLVGGTTQDAPVAVATVTSEEAQVGQGSPN